MKCLNCKHEIYEYDFCPHCGTPISELAKKVEIKKNTNIRLETLLKLVNLIDDDKTLNIIKELVNKLKSED
jgi:predicted amidophosphoribosyltransferase